MKRIIAILTLLSCVSVAQGQQHQNQKKGFNANDVYQFNGLDSINAFNGNLNLAIPLGAAYSVGGGLSYKFVLYSNANVWEAETHCDSELVGGGPCPVLCPRFDHGCAPEALVYPTFMYPHRRANAGIGWTLSLGRLYQPGHPAMGERLLWIYESPDGADHPFWDGLTTADGTHLRISEVNDPEMGLARLIEFSNGEMHYFAPDAYNDHWALRRITNRYPGNFVRISYSNGTPWSNGVRWTISDSHGRTHYIDFKKYNYDSEMRPLVEKVSLSVYGGSAPFEFQYTETDMGRGEFHNDTFHDVPGHTTAMTTVPVLDKVTLPDGLFYEFTYRNAGLLETNGVPTSMVVPTGGQIVWEWGDYQKPALSAAATEEYFALSLGVFKRKFYTRPGVGGSRTLEGTWTYEPEAVGGNPPGGGWPDCYHTSYLPANQQWCHEYRTTITDPLGNKTRNYFSVATQNDDPPWQANEYGLPFTKKTDDGTPGPGKRWLSTEVLNAAGTPLRSTFVRYSHVEDPPLVESTRVKYHDDGNQYYVDSDKSGYLAGTSLYKTVTQSSNIPDTPRRITTTNYRLPSSAWILGLYDSVIVTEGEKASRRDFCFDDDTGFLLQKRDRMNAASPSSSDLIVQFVPDLLGNVNKERYFGGDVNATADRDDNVRPVPSVAPGEFCGTLTSTPSYEVEHLRVEPTASTNGSIRSRYPLNDVDFSDVTIDRRSGLISKSRDTSGVETSYEYDWAGRIKAEKVPGRADTVYDYLGDASDEVAVKRIGAGNVIRGWSKFKVDGFGRVIQERKLMPDNAQSSSNIVYDAKGQRVSVSEPNQPTALTEFSYDVLGRTTEVESPDGSKVTFGYQGDRVKTRTSKIRTGSNETSVTVTETYDGLGRLRKVTEPAGATTASLPVGQPVTAAYRYDLADRLTQVEMQETASTVQYRIFDYDGRGFLRWESHPESGVTSYLYDARGHIATKLQGGAQSQFDLDYFYDPAERLVRLESRNPLYGPGAGESMHRLLKSFQYSTINSEDAGVINWSKGKLLLATRYNYSKFGVDTSLNMTDTQFMVQDHFEYHDLSGRQTHRTTTISQTLSGESSAEVWREIDTHTVFNELDQIDHQSYPQCEGCGIPAGDWLRTQMTRTYDAGRLETINGVINGISYWPNGLRHVQQHANLVADTQETDDMPRPLSLSFGQSPVCVQPVLAALENQESDEPNEDVVLSASASGTGPITYEWFDGNTLLGWGSSITVAPAVDTAYKVRATNSCGEVEATLEVGVGHCKAPRTGLLEALQQPDNTWILKARPRAAAGATYTWTNLSDNSVVGNDASKALSTVSETTTYRFTVQDSCGSATGTVMINVPLSMTTTGFAAEESQNHAHIHTSWPAVSGASSYLLERRGSDGSYADWDSLTSTTFDDTTASANVVYAYRVQAIGSSTSSNYSNTDLATHRTFTQAVAGGAVGAAPFDDMLNAVNAVRAIAGWPALTWSNVLSPSDPLVSTGNNVAARQLLAARARMNEALQAVGSRTENYMDAQVEGVQIKAAHINEVQERVQ